MRGLVVVALLLFAQESDLQKLIQRLGSSSFEEQGKAADAIQKLGAAALPELIKASNDGNQQIREWCLKIRSTLEKEMEAKKAAAEAAARDYIEQLLASLGSKDPAESKQASEDLKKRWDCVPYVRKALERTQSVELRMRLVVVLDAFEPKVQMAAIEPGPVGWVTKYPSRTAARAPILTKAGAGAPTEAAVQSGLIWLARHQEPTGAWKPDGFPNRCTGKQCQGPGERDFDAGVTALALMAFLGTGITPESKDEAPDPLFVGKPILLGDCVRRGLAWLISQQDREGCIGERGMQYMYNHLIATGAIMEAYGMTGSPSLKVPAQRALNFVVDAQNPGKGWRYSARCGDNDTSVTGWAVAALRAAQLADFDIPEKSWAGAQTWLNEATDRRNGVLGYNAAETGKVFIPGKNESFNYPATLTAIGIYSRALLPRPKRPAIVLEKKDAPPKAYVALTGNVPRWHTNDTDTYYWYWGSLAVLQQDGPAGKDWKKWFDGLKTALVPAQIAAGDGCAAGSWDALVDCWGCAGGRVSSTALAVLALETPYRFSRVESK